MSVKVENATRRAVIFGAATVASLPLLTPGNAKAGIITPANAKYQAQPKNGAHCSQCTYFLPGSKPDANGTCKQVSGVISPNGWCQFYSKKPGAK